MSEVVETIAKSDLETTDTSTNNNLTPNSKLETVQSVEGNNSKDYGHNGHKEPKNSSSNSTEKEIVSESETSVFEIGSRVANNNPEKKSYNWHGKIVGFSNDGADVCWDEREGMQGGQVLWHRLTELRLL